MVKDEVQLAGAKYASELPAYPIDMSQLLTLWQFSLDDAGIPFQLHSTEYHPILVAQYALSQWNQYLATNDQNHCSIFLRQARWFVGQEISIGENAGGWPISSPHPDVRGNGPWLSALVQGYALSIPIRAYQLTQEEKYLLGSTSCSLHLLEQRFWMAVLAHL